MSSIKDERTVSSPPDRRPDDTPGAAASQPITGAVGDELLARLRRLEDDLIAAQRLMMLGTITDMVAHEVNNLMMEIIMMGHAALADGDPAFQRRALDQAVAAATKATAVTRELRKLADSAPTTAAACLVAEAAQAVILASVRPFSKDGIEVRVEIPADLRIQADPVLFEQVLLNLVLNARAAMKSHPGRLTLAARCDDNQVVIEVHDSGKGLPPEHIETVINPFLAAEPGCEPLDFRAVGTGLNVCRLIARRHGASIRARANEGRGCTFELRWPTALTSK